MDSEYDRGALSALTFCLSDFDLPLCQLSLVGFTLGFLGINLTTAKVHALRSLVTEVTGHVPSKAV